MDRKTALLGGSFNPPHLAHLLMAGAALGEADCAELWLVPCVAHPFGKELLPYKDRADMCQALVALFEGRLRISLVEGTLGEPSYTVRTLEALHKDYPGRKFAWVIGSDNLPQFPKWKDAARIRELSEIWVVGREGAQESGDKDFRWIGGMALPPISSTDIRERLARHESIAGFVPGPVRSLIEERKYYL